MTKSIATLYVGLDVHKDSIDIAVAEAGRGGEVRHVGSFGGDLASLGKALRKLLSCGRPLHIVYEAGSCGFVIWRHLHANVAPLVSKASFEALLQPSLGPELGSDNRSCCAAAHGLQPSS